MKILVAEDHAPSLYLLEQVLSTRGHTVWSARNGSEALRLLARHGPADLVISDALMPEMDGFELCDTLRRDPRLCGLPFIIYTATYTAEGDEAFALSVGADRYVIKPVEPEQLLGIIADVVARAGAGVPRTPRTLDENSSFFREHARRMSVKLESKVAELSSANEALSASERSVRELNQRLTETVRRLESEVLERRRTEELLRLAQAVGGIGSWGVDHASGQTWWSEEASRICGLPAGTPCPSPAEFFAMVVPEDRAAAAQAVGEAHGEHRDLELELRILRRDGQKRIIFFRSEVFRDASNRPLRRIGTLQDVTVRRTAEAERIALEQRLRQAGKMEAIGHLAGGIAHDFNNLLAVMLGNAELLQLTRPPAPAGAEERAQLGEIINACGRARDLVSQILTFSRRQAVERRQLTLATVVQDALKFARAALPPAIELRVELASRRAILANENQIHQIVLNLCTNAAHALGAKGGYIALTLTPFEVSGAFARRGATLREGTHLRLDVRDNGCGMDQVTLEHIFEPFFTTKGPGEGTGLGLAVVHGIVEAHDGAIFVESTPGQGTTFSMFFPVVDSTPAPAARTSSVIVATGRGQRVLLVDDEPAVAKIGASLLTRLGYQATALNDPLAARQRLLADPQAFDLVVTDYLMPRLNGLELAQAAWTVRPGLPFILIVGFGGAMDVAQAREAGFREFVAKPFTVQTLGDALARVLA